MKKQKAHRAGYHGSSLIKNSFKQAASFLGFISLFILAFSFAIDNDFTFISNFGDICFDKCSFNCGIIAIT